jgi:hypothetical protein
MAEAIDPMPKPKRSGFRKFLWFTGVFVLGVGGAYGAGRLQTQNEIDALDGRLLQTRQGLESAEQRVAQQGRQLAELEARRRIHRALIDFDQNNFGTAQEELRSAATLLDSGAAGDPALSALASSMRTLELAPSLDIAAQRAALVALATKFDTLRPPAAP